MTESLAGKRRSANIDAIDSVALQPFLNLLGQTARLLVVRLSDRLGCDLPRLSEIAACRQGDRVKLEQRYGWCALAAENRLHKL